MAFAFISRWQNGGDEVRTIRWPNTGKRGEKWKGCEVKTEGTGGDGEALKYDVLDVSERVRRTSES